MTETSPVSPNADWALVAVMYEIREALDLAAAEPVPDLEQMTWRAGAAAGAGHRAYTALKAVLELCQESGSMVYPGRVKEAALAALTGKGAPVMPAGARDPLRPVHLLGKRVRVTLDRDDGHGGRARVAEGKLLCFGDSGELVIECDDLFVYYAWPMLDVEEATGQ